ncbi:MAG: SUF system NifU family Fe-S cluster assembly protein [Chloroflexi bacterium]|nr:SUF system NifU family Fe-S cluster assembly protein [Chloroflexota bacterium]
MTESADLDEMYREIVLDHHRNPRNSEPIDAPTHEGEAINPFCGDEVHVKLHLQDGVIDHLSVTGVGCSISQAAASLMGAEIKGKTTEQIGELARQFKSLMSGGADSLESDLDVLKGVKRYPVRIKCALLAWSALEDALSG